MLQRRPREEWDADKEMVVGKLNEIRARKDERPLNTNEAKLAFRKWLTLHPVEKVDHKEEDAERREGGQVKRTYVLSVCAALWLSSADRCSV